VSKKKVIAQIIVSLIATALITLLIISRFDEIIKAVKEMSLIAFISVILIQLAAYLLRVHTWSMVLKIAGAPVEKRPLHSSSGAAFLTNCFFPIYVGQWARVFILKTTSKNPPKISQMFIAEGASIFVEMIIVFLVLIISISALPFGGLVVLFFAVSSIFLSGLIIYLLKHHHEREWVKSLHIFKKKRDLAKFSFLLMLVMFSQILRFEIVLNQIANVSLAKSALAFIGAGVAGIIPVGPATSSVGGIIAGSGVGLDQAIAAGVLLSATAIIAATIYLLISGGAQFIFKRRKDLEEIPDEEPLVLGP
jgi:hypothetical protein